MVITYKDNDDMVLVIKDYKKLKDLPDLIGKLTLASTGSLPVEASDVEAAKAADAAPELPSITNDKEFAQAAGDLSAGRYNGPLRKEVGNRINSYIRSRFPASLKDDNARNIFVGSMSSSELSEMRKNFTSVIDQKGFKTAFERKYGSSVDDPHTDDKDIIAYLIKVLTNQ